ncbi:MAG: hypothetical protein LBG99_08020, partial [Propionibacteriaceae bacterium]|nr:hypothetical protein [Propionibacteriaceae bacterium]
LQGHTSWVRGCAISADGQTIVTASTDGTARTWNPDGETLLEIQHATTTRIWLDSDTETLQIDGPDWPHWQLVSSDPNQPNQLGSTIAHYGPRAHELLANAGYYNFAPYVS